MRVLWLAFTVVFFDQLVKDYIRHNFALHESVRVFPGLFDLRYVQNTGAAWGIFEGFNAMLVILSFAVILALVVFRKHFLADTLLCRLAMGLMLGGIVGNLLDRLRYGHVVDYLYFYQGSHSFPAFNIADAAICTGVCLYMISQLMGEKPAKSETAGQAADSTQGTSPVQVGNDRQNS